MPGAIDPHTHLEMAFGGTVTCDDFTSGTVSAAFGGTTCLDRLLHADARARRSRRRSRSTTRRSSAASRSSTSASTSASPTCTTGGTLDDLAKLPDEGITSYKLFMAYKGAVMVDDETLFRTMEVASETGAIVMVHAENGDAIDVLVKKAVAEGKTEPIWHALDETARSRRGGDEPRHPARPARRLPALRRPRLLQGGDRADRARPGRGLAELRRDVHAVPLHRRDGAAAAELRRRQVHLHAAAADEGAPGASLAGSRERRALGRLDRPLPLQLGRAEDARQGRLLEDPERRAGDREPAPHAPPLRRPRGPHLAGTASSSSSRRTLRSRSASTRARARSRPGPTPTSSSGIRRSASRSRPRRTTRTSTTTCSRAPRSSAPRRSCSYAAR